MSVTTGRLGLNWPVAAAHKYTASDYPPQVQYRALNGVWLRTLASAVGRRPVEAARGQSSRRAGKETRYPVAVNTFLPRPFGHFAWAFARAARVPSGAPKRAETNERHIVLRRKKRGCVVVSEKEGCGFVTGKGGVCFGEGDTYGLDGAHGERRVAQLAGCLWTNKKARSRHSVRCRISPRETASSKRRFALCCMRLIRRHMKPSRLETARQLSKRSNAGLRSAATPMMRPHATHARLACRCSTLKD